jgi:O-antigen/teichoic acid export membrane protein
MNPERTRLSVWGALVWFAGSYGVALIGYVLINAIASRMLGRQDFGYFVIAITATTLIGQIGLLGVHRSGLREAARLELTDTEGLAGLRRGVRAVSLVTLPLVSVVSAVVTFVIIDAENAPTRWAASLGIGLLVLLGGQQKIWANYLRGFGEVRFASLLEGRSGGALVSLLQAAFLGLAWWLAPDSGLPGAIGAVALGFAVPVWIARSRVVRLWHHTAIEPRRLLADVRVVLRRDWRFTSNQTATYLNSTIELWLCGLVLSSVDTSNFGAAQRLAMMLVIPLTSLQVVFAPVISRLLVRDDDKRLEDLLRGGASLATAGTAVLWIPMLLFPALTLTLIFGSGFGEAAPILVLLTLGNVANVVVGLCGTVLIMSHHEGSVATVQWCAVVARVLIGTAAALAFGAIGLGVSAAVCTVALYAAMWFVTKRETGLQTQVTLHPKLRLLKSTTG